MTQNSISNAWVICRGRTVNIELGRLSRHLRTVFDEASSSRRLRLAGLINGCAERTVEASVQTPTDRFFTLIKDHVCLSIVNSPHSDVITHFVAYLFMDQSNMLGNTLICHRSHLCASRSYSFSHWMIIWRDLLCNFSPTRHFSPIAKIAKIAPPVSSDFLTFFPWRIIWSTQWITDMSWKITHNVSRHWW